MISVDIVSNFCYHVISSDGKPSKKPRRLVMKKVVVDAKVPENVEKGISAMTAAITVDYAENIKEAVEMFGEEAVLTNAFANWRVTLQGNIRGALRRGENADAIAARLASAKMGVAQSGGKADPVQAYLAAFQSATPDKQKEMLAELQKRAAK